MPTNVYTLAGFVLEYLNTQTIINGQNIMLAFPTFREACEYIMKGVQSEK